MAKILLFKKDEDLTNSERVLKQEQADKFVMAASYYCVALGGVALGAVIAKHKNNVAWMKAIRLCYEKNPELEEMIIKAAREVQDDLGIKH